MPLPNTEIEYDDTGWSEAFRIYLDLRRSVDPKKELRRRAKNIGMRLITIYAMNAPTKDEIRGVADQFGFRVRVRPRIKKLNVPWQRKVELEIRARVRARMFTATGWFPAVEKLGGNPRGRLKKQFRGPRRGRLEERFGFFDFSETLVNLQPGAAQTADRAGNALQQAIEQEVDDMLVYINRKLDEAARRAGL